MEIGVTCSSVVPKRAFRDDIAGLGGTYMLRGRCRESARRFGDFAE